MNRHNLSKSGIFALLFFLPNITHAGKLDLFTILKPMPALQSDEYHLPESNGLWQPGSRIYFRGEPREIRIAGRAGNIALAIIGLTQSHPIGFSVIAIGNILHLWSLIFDDSARYARSDWDFLWDQ